MRIATVVGGSSATLPDAHTGASEPRSSHVREYVDSLSRLRSARRYAGEHRSLESEDSFGDAAFSCGAERERANGVRVAVPRDLERYATVRIHAGLVGQNARSCGPQPLDISHRHGSLRYVGPTSFFESTPESSEQFCKTGSFHSHRSLCTDLCWLSDAPRL